MRIRMHSVAEAKKKLLKSLAVVGTENVPLEEAVGRVLAADFVAQLDSPIFATSSMDGFAVKASDIKEAKQETPVELRVAGDIPAGSYSDHQLEEGTALRIMTGAPVPKGADVVLPVEETDVVGRGPDFPLPEKILAYRSLKRGKHVRPIGEDFQPGDRLLRAGKILRAQEVALLAMNGMQEIGVRRALRVVLFSSGDELRVPGEALQPGQIYESNSFAIAANLKELGADVTILPIAPDNLNKIIALLDQALEASPDLILSSAGVSVGTHDYVRDAILSKGNLDLWKVDMKPGKPLAFGDYGGIPVIALPGNPVSSFVSFEIFARPAILRMSGSEGQTRLKVWGKLAEDVRLDGRETYFRGVYIEKKRKLLVSLTGSQGSGNLYSLVRANCLVRIPAGKKKLTSGAKVEIWPI